MGLVNHMDLPQGVQVQTGVSLDYEELHSSHALEDTEQLWLPDEFPPDLVNEGRERREQPR